MDLEKFPDLLSRKFHKRPYNPAAVSLFSQFKGSCRGGRIMTHSSTAAETSFEKRLWMPAWTTKISKHTWTINENELSKRNVFNTKNLIKRSKY
jgi:hypothetical protein